MKCSRGMICQMLLMVIIFTAIRCSSADQGDENLCPSECHCKGCVIDCKSRHLHSIPSFPPGACSINLSKNLISMIQIVGSSSSTGFRGSPYYCGCQYYIGRTHHMFVINLSCIVNPVIQEISNLSITIFDSDVMEGAFSNLPKLSSVDLSNNRITLVDNKAFLNSPALSSLILASNQLQTVETSVFYPIPNIEILDISQNQLQSIPNIRSVSKLKYLYLGGNQFTEFKFGPGYRSAIYLTRITLSNNPKVTHIKRGDFDSLSNSTNIANLKLSRCSITSVDERSFLSLSTNLVSLSLSQNPQLNSSTLQTILTDLNDSRRLTSLDLSWIGLNGTVSASTFTALGDKSLLMKLDLSHNEHLKGIDDGAFDALANLQVLYIAGANLVTQPKLSNNARLRDLDMTSNNIKNLYETRFPAGITRLRLGSNRITDLKSRVFSRLTSLQQLDLSGNSLVRFEADCLVGLGSLQTLDMSGNTISALPRGVFKSLGSLTSLDLSKNDIIYINATGNDGFAVMTRLSSLDLSSNAIRYFNPTLFHGMKNLKTLQLSNGLLGVPFSDQSYDYTGFLSSLASLQLVNMSSNGIKILPRQMISNTPALEVLDLSRNEIYSWDSQQTFKGAAGLKKLLLNSNSLALFNDTTSFAVLNNLTVLDLSSNPFACTCDMRWFRDWLKSTKVHVNNSHAYTCVSPASMQGTHLMEFELTVLQCVPVWVWIVTGCTIGVLVIIILICILYRYRWRIRFALYKCCKSCHGDAKSSGRYERVQGCERTPYAAFLSFCEYPECVSIIEHQILPNISSDTPDGHASIYPVIHRLDYEFGKTYYSNFADALEKSKATVVILCQHYKSDRRCELELAESLRLREEESRKIIPLVLDECIQRQPKLVPTALRVMLKNNEAIEWHRNEQQARLDMLRGRLAEVMSFAAVADDLQSDYGSLAA